MVTNKKCIVSLATKNSRYVDGLARLSNSLSDNADGIDFLGFIHEKSVGASLHTEYPYGFKVNAIQKAIDAGYTKILWLDVSAYAVAPVQPLFDLIESQGYFFEGAGCWLGDWCNDEALDYFKITREEAKLIPMIQSGFMGFDFEYDYTKLIWEQFRLAYTAGMFSGSWDNHRHDQSCMSAILNTLVVNFSHQPKYVQYGGIFDQPISDKIILKCQGM